MSGNIVISGMSCRFPGSTSYQEFWRNLLAKKDMVTEDDRKWPAGSFGIPKRFGKIDAVNHFDAAFFGVHGKQAEKMDPQLRLLLEISYEAFIDAGIDPDNIRGSNTGVFVGACFSDMNSISSYNIESITGYENSGCSLSMFSNRLSFYYDFHGPSHTVDTACSSSIVALDAAISALNEGKCDYAVVGGSNIIFSPSVSLGFVKLKMLSPTGACKSFDQSGDGYARAEGVAAIILTRESLAKRVRARIHGSAVNSDGYTDKGITFPNGEAQQRLLTTLYKQCEINPEDISYIEAHGTGTAVGDPQEVNAIEQALNISKRNSDSPLFIGSIKSNMGHAEGAAGMASLIKVLLCMEHGMIPANLHYSTPNENIAALLNGTIKVVDEHMPWDGGIVGINSFGFGGTNAHVILEGGIKQKTNNKSTDDQLIIPVIPCAARTQKAVDDLLNTYSESDISQNVAGFMQSVANRSTQSFQYRGCLVSDSSGQVDENRIFKGKVAGKPSEVWFIYPGMGSQWNGMGEDLMSHPVFSNSIQALQKALDKTEINLVQLLSSLDANQFTKPVETFVAITAIQLALTDMALAYGITPTGIIGHSVGEMACAYADSAITKEQAILAAYYRGKSIEQCPDSLGKMAVAQLSWRDAQKYCTEGVIAACHNSEYSVTFSGETNAIDSLVKVLQSEGCDIQEVNSTGIAFHSPLIKNSAPILNAYLSDVIPKPKERSSRWISTSHPENEWQDATTCSAKYFVDNLVNPVLFHDALKHIPDNAIVIELGPHSLMHASLIDSTKDSTYINMMRRDYNCQETFNNALAQSYVAGVNIDWTGSCYQPSIQTSQFSVPELTGWDHSTPWKLPDLEKDILKSNADFTYNIDLSKDEYRYITDHQLNNRIVMPGLSYLHLVWQTASKISRIPINQLKIQLSEVRFHRATMIPQNGSADLKVRYLPSSHRFEVVERDDLVASGHVAFGDEVVLPEVAKPEGDGKDKLCFMQTADVYKELRLRGYNYGPAFNGIKRVSTDGCFIDVHWEHNWVTFLDCLLHSSIVRHERKTLMPTYIRKMTIDPNLQPDQTIIESYSDKYIRRISSNSVVMEDCEFGVMPQPSQKDQASLHYMEFVPFNESNCLEHSADSSVAEYIQFVNSYVLTQFSNLLEYANNNNITIPEHIEKLNKVISPCKYTAFSDKQLEKFEQHPNAMVLRLAKHIYSQPELLLEDAMPLIISFEEYNVLYKHDMATSFLFSDRYLGGMIQIIMENMGSSRPINFCEVGTGTGGITAHILPFLRSSEDTYKITDISSGFFEKLKDEFASYNAVTEYVPWDISNKAPESIGNNLDLVTASNVIHASPNVKQALDNIHDALTDGGFLLLHETTHGYSTILGIWGFINDIWNYNDEQDRSNGAFVSKQAWIDILNESGFDLISTKDDGQLCTLYLCRKRPAKKPTNIFINATKIEQDLPSIQKHLSAIHGNENARLWIHGNRQSTPGLIGLINCARRESEGHRLRTIYNDSDETISIDRMETAIDHDLAVSVYRDSQWGSFRYLDTHKNDCRLTDNAYLDIGTKGDLSSLRWIASPESNRINYAYDACYCAINFKDVMIATGKLTLGELDGTLAHSIGGEFSGVSPNGRRVMGFLGGQLTTKIRVDEIEAPYVWDVPDNWTLEQAATVPVVYMTAYLALVVRANIKPGQRVLIHSGTGGVGQAAIRVALSKGCEIFATVGTQEKRDLLQSLFPEISSDHIYSSRNTQFENGIMNVTKGKGVQVILNSLADDKLQASLRVLSRYGQFMEIGKYDMTQNTAVGMQLYLRDVTFSGIGLDNVTVDNPECLKVISDCLKEGITSGVVQPLESTVFNHDQLEKAFRFMAAGKHTGKVLLKVRDGEPNSETCVSAMPKFWCSASKSYLITGGLGGFGFELARWLIGRGAKRIILTSRSGVKNSYQQYWLNIWKNEGISVAISNLDVSNKQQAKSLITELKNPLGGIFHLAMILSDAFLSNQTSESFERVVNVKYNACQYLDELSRELCPELDHFVMFSSLTGGVGNPGQSNYGYANFAMDRLCETRKHQGLPALAIQWGAIGDVGFVSENKNYVDTKALLNKEQSLASCLETLDTYLQQDKPIVASYVRYCDIFDRADNDTNYLHDGEKTEEQLLQYIKNILGITEGTEISDDTKFIALGMDSLMVVEIQIKLETEYGIKLALPAIQQLDFTAIKNIFNDNTSDTTDSDDKNTKSFIKNKNKEIFELFSGNNNDSNIIYFINGFASDPVSVLEELDIPENNRIYIIRYEQAGNMDKLANAWEQHILDNASSSNNIHIVGYSTGATIAHRFKQIKTSPHLAENIKYTNISTPNESHFEPLNAFSLDTIDDIDQEAAIVQLKTMPWFGDFRVVSREDLVGQVKFILADHFYSKDLSTVDKTIIPLDDEICWSIDKAKTLSSNVEQVDGVHDLRTLPLHDIMFS